MFVYRHKRGQIGTRKRLDQNGVWGLILGSYRWERGGWKGDRGEVRNPNGVKNFHP